MKSKVIKMQNLFETAFVNQAGREDAIILYSLSLSFNPEKKKHSPNENSKLDNMDPRSAACTTETCP